MTAELVKLPVPRRWRAWCEPCQDGYQGGKPACLNWADKHNRNRHPPVLTFACRLDNGHGVCAGEIYLGSIFGPPSPCECPCHKPPIEKIELAPDGA